MDKKIVFVLGDSISIHYGPYLKEMIRKDYLYDRKRGMEQAFEDLDKPIGANAGDSSMVLEYLRGEKGKGVKYDILLLNCGLHDIRVDKKTGAFQISTIQSKKNLMNIAAIAKEMSDKVIWVGLTPIIDRLHNGNPKVGFYRYNKDVINYDRFAREIMLKEEILTIDLYAFTSNLCGDIYQDHVHFKNEIRALQAAFIADNIYRNMSVGQFEYEKIKA